MIRKSSTHIEGLVRELCKLPKETEWVEFKENDLNPHEMGEYIAAIANSAALSGKNCGYVVWGVRDNDHSMVGTTFDPKSERRGNEELENWLLRMLHPRIDFRFHEVEIGGQRVVVLEIDRAIQHPVAFSGIEYIRVGSYKKNLKDFPEKERALWRIFERIPFEEGIALEETTIDDVLLKLAYPDYFHLLNLPLPDGKTAILESLQHEGLIALGMSGGFNITNLGAILFARDLADFPTLQRKAVRVIQYRGKGRTETVREHLEQRGYANGFGTLLGLINSLLPTNEVLGQALRRSVPMFPELAIRELVANALIHQEFSITGAGPMIELFQDRVEVTNPGEPLISTDRFLDSPPKSRNETMASLMRRIGVCEERGSGIDKVVAQIEMYQLPAPLFEVPPHFTRVVLFSHKPLSEMDKDDRIRACYLHACLKYVERDFLTNSSLRIRFGIDEQNRATASRLIREATDAGVIVAHDPNAPPKKMRYVPWWASSVR